MSINDRFRLVMEREHLTVGAFAESIGVAQATISHILGGRNKMPSTEVILRLHNRYKDISLDWLLTGEGAMTESASGESEELDDSIDESPLLDSDNSDFAAPGTLFQNNRKEMAVKNGGIIANHPVKQEIIYKERPHKKITEIRIFFDDNTYETFTP